jgi:hypothetical protein
MSLKGLAYHLAVEHNFGGQFNGPLEKRVEELIKYWRGDIGYWSISPKASMLTKIQESHTNRHKGKLEHDHCHEGI